MAIPDERLNHLPGWMRRLYEVKRRFAMTPEKMAETYLWLAADPVGKIVRRAIQNSMGAPNMIRNSEVQTRKEVLIREARTTLRAIQNLAGHGVIDPWADAGTLARAVMEGVLDAPQLINNKFGKGVTRTRVVNGACEAVDSSGKFLSEKERFSKWV